MSPKERSTIVLNLLKTVYLNPRPLLDFENNFQLLIAVILSAQTTDNQVNSILPELFAQFPDPAALANADLNRLQEIIFPTGYFRAKAKNIKATAEKLIKNFNGDVPNTIEELISLPGVGRKSANVVIGHGYGKPAVIVDTHFSRVSRRIGVTTAEAPEKIEREIKELVEPENQFDFSMVINYHGRYCCKARKPECYRCPIEKHCLFEEKVFSESYSRK